nr:hypothetical protein [uncultured Oscillibacter sp.]
MKEGYWVVRTYEAGPVGEKTKFWIPGVRSDRQTRREKSEIRKQEQNEYSAVKQMARLINANYGPGDLLLGLDYSEEGMARLLAWAESQGADLETADEAERMDFIRSAAEREMRLLLRRVKRELDKTGTALRYIAITSDMDGDTGESVRIHHHLVVPAEVRDAFVEKWQGMGGVDWELLSGQEDYTPIAEYLVKQVRRVPDAKKYVSSRNLVRPQPKDRVALTDAELRVPKGGKLLHRNEFQPGRAQYIRYVLPEDRRPPRPSPGRKTA